MHFWHSVSVTYPMKAHANRQRPHKQQCCDRGGGGRFQISISISLSFKKRKEKKIDSMLFGDCPLKCMKLTTGHRTKKTAEEQDKKTFGRLVAPATSACTPVSRLTHLIEGQRETRSLPCIPYTSLRAPPISAWLPLCVSLLAILALPRPDPQEKRHNRCSS